MVRSPIDCSQVLWLLQKRKVVCPSQMHSQGLRSKVSNLVSEFRFLSLVGPKPWIYPNMMNKKIELISRRSHDFGASFGLTVLPLRSLVSEARRQFFFYLTALGRVCHQRLQSRGHKRGQLSREPGARISPKKFKTRDHLDERDSRCSGLQWLVACQTYLQTGSQF